jgi:hypothetical protein
MRWFEPVTTMLDGCRASADVRLSFQKTNVNAAGSQQRRGGEPANATTHNHDFVTHRLMKKRK